MVEEFKNYIELRSVIDKDLSPEWFKRDPMIGVITAIFFGLYWALFYLGTQYPMAILPIGIILGFIAEFLSMANHDILHGSVFRSKIFSVLFCIPNSLITLISPSFWKFWHNFHHKSVDRWSKDHRPFEMGYETYGYPKLRKMLGMSELFVYKIIHLTRTQVRFLFDKRYKSPAHLELKRVVFIQFSLIVLFKIVLFIYLPFWMWLGLELLPLLIQSFLSSIFLATQHSHKMDKDEGIRTFSVKLPRFLELWFLNVGYHIEHHLYPNMPSMKLPALKKVIEKRYPMKPSLSVSMTDALKEIYKN